MSQTPPPQAAVVEGSNTLSAYCNRIIGFEFDNANYTIVFGHQRTSAGENQPKNHVVARLTLPAQAVVELVNGLNALARTVNERRTAEGGTPEQGNA